MITLKQLYSFLTKTFPLKFQEEWDESGIKQFNKSNQVINKVAICLDPSLTNINQAIKSNVDLIISHHPIFTNNKEIKLNSTDKKTLSLLKKHKISLISFHTNVDNNPIGLNYFLSKTLGFNNIKIKKNAEGSYASSNIQKIKFNDLLKKLKTKLNTYTNKGISNGNKINQIALCSGSSFSVLKKSINSFGKNTCLITGDIKWHDWVYANDLNLNLIDIGHDAEKFFIELIVKTIKVKIPLSKIIKINTNIGFIKN